MFVFAFHQLGDAVVQSRSAAAAMSLSDSLPVFNRVRHMFRNSSVSKNVISLNAGAFKMFKGALIFLQMEQRSDKWCGYMLILVE